MPIDPNILLSIRPPEIQNPLAAHLQMAQLRSSENQNALAQYTLAKARRDDEAANALALAYREATNPDGTINQGTLISRLSQGSAAGQIPTVQKNLQAAEKERAEIKDKEAQLVKHRLEVLGGALVAGMKDPSDANLGMQFAALKAAGVPTEEIAKVLLANPDLTARRQMIQSYAMSNEVGRKALEAIQSKPHFTNTGAETVGLESNPLAGTVGTRVGSSVPMVMSPEQKDASARGWAQLNQPVWDTERGVFITRPGVGKAATPASIKVPGVDPKDQTPASLKEKIAQNNVALSKIDRAMQELETRPESFGLKNVLGDTVRQRTDPGGVTGRALVANIGSQIIHDRSGANVTVGEAPRLVPFVPNVNDDAETIKQKLAALRTEYVQMQKELSQGKSINEVAYAKGNTAKGAVSRAPQAKPSGGIKFLGWEEK